MSTSTTWDLDSVLQPGSSFHPTFLAIVDGAFVFLFLVFLSLTVLTEGKNPHFYALMAIELCLWVSLKWFVSEWKKLGESNSQVTVVEHDGEKVE